MTKLLYWDIYEVTTSKGSLNNVMLRGRIRKLGLERGINILTENTTDIENAVRFAVLSGQDISFITEYLRSIIPDIKIEAILTKLQNPVLSKLKVNKEERYTL